MDVGDRVVVPPAEGGLQSPGAWVEATVVELGTTRQIRDPADGSTRPHQPVKVRYADGQTRSWDRYYLEPRQGS